MDADSHRRPGIAGRAVVTISELPLGDSAATDALFVAPSAVGARRALDIALVAIAAPIWIPVALGTAVAVAVSSGRPVFFSQQRIGRHGKPFTMFKFRSMKTGPNPLIPTADRLTPIGGALRKTSLDEIPQLLNVLGGSMSLVGPRPMLPEQDAHLSPKHRARRSVRPGLTGLAQVSGRNTLQWHERLELDVAWVSNATVGSYARTIWQTFGVVTGQQGVDGHSAADPFVRLTTADAEQPPSQHDAATSVTDHQETAQRAA